MNNNNNSYQNSTPRTRTISTVSHYSSSSAHRPMSFSASSISPRSSFSTAGGVPPPGSIHSSLPGLSSKDFSLTHYDGSDYLAGEEPTPFWGTKYPHNFNAWTFYSLLFMAMLTGLFSGSPNAFDSISQLIQKGANLSNTTTSLLKSMGLLGIFFTLPVGYLRDRLGSSFLAILSAFGIFTGFFVMSLCDEKSQGLMIVAYTLAGFASGGAFIAALGVAISLSSETKTWPISFVAASMSWSLGVITLVYRMGMNISQCKSDNECWIACIQITAIVAGVITLISGVLFRLLPHHAPEIPETDEDEPLLGTDEDIHKHKPVSFQDSVKILKHYGFWALFIGYFSSITAGLLIVAEITEIWEWFIDTSASTAAQADTIRFAFSLTNCSGTLMAAALSDHLKSTGTLARHKFTALTILFQAFILLIISFIFFSRDSGDPSVVHMTVFLLTIVVGFSFGAGFTLFPTLTSEYYGGDNFGVCFGWVQFSSAVSSFAAVFMVQFLYEEFNSFAPPFFATGVCCLISFVMLWIKPGPFVWKDHPEFPINFEPFHYSSAPSSPRSMGSGDSLRSDHGMTFEAGTLPPPGAIVVQNAYQH